MDSPPSLRVFCLVVLLFNDVFHDLSVFHFSTRRSFSFYWTYIYQPRETLFFDSYVIRLAGSMVSVSTTFICSRLNRSTAGGKVMSMVNGQWSMVNDHVPTSDSAACTVTGRFECKALFSEVRVGY